MKTNLNKLVKLIAAGLFLIALAINVKVTLNDPLTIEEEHVLAQTTNSGDTKTCYDTITGADGQQVRYCGTCSWLPGEPSYWAGKKSCKPNSLLIVNIMLSEKFCFLCVIK